MSQARSAGEDTVVAFRPPAFRTKRERPDDDAVRGTILLFTGVRYERMIDAAESQAPRSDTRNSRDEDIWA